MRLALLVLAVAPIIHACSTVTVAVPVVRPASIDLHGKRELVVGSIEGDHGPELAHALKDAVASSGYFKLVDRTHLDAVLSELRLGVSDLAQPAARARLGQLMTGSVLVAGSIDRYSYRENVERSKVMCSRTENGRSVDYECWAYERKGQANVIAALDVIDVATGENLRPNRLECALKGYTSSKEEEPPPIDDTRLLDLCATNVVTRFMQAIAPWSDREEVEFSRDGDLPSLETGIRFAELGQWSEAIEAFRQAIALADTLPSLSAGDRAKAHRDLGLAYTYTGMFAEARAELKKAYAMAGDEGDLRKIQNVDKLEAERRSLDVQLGPGSAE